NDLPALMKRTDTWLNAGDESPGNTPANKLPDTPATDTRDDDARDDTSVSVVLQLFREVLNAPDCGAHDSFFDLGGHSLLAMQLIGRIREQTGHTITLTDLFDAPSPAELAGVLVGKTLS